jgi:hypothetical protein
MRGESEWEILLRCKTTKFNQVSLFINWDMELVETADISAVLEDAMHEASDPKQKNALSNMLLELNKSPLGKRDI